MDELYFLSQQVAVVDDACIGTKKCHKIILRLNWCWWRPATDGCWSQNTQYIGENYEILATDWTVSVTNIRGPEQFRALNALLEDLKNVTKILVVTNLVVNMKLSQTTQKAYFQVWFGPEHTVTSGKFKLVSALMLKFLNFRSFLKVNIMIILLGHVPKNINHM